MLIFYLLNGLSKVYTTPLDLYENWFRSGWIGSHSHSLSLKLCYFLFYYEVLTSCVMFWHSFPPFVWFSALFLFSPESYPDLYFAIWFELFFSWFGLWLAFVFRLCIFSDLGFTALFIVDKSLLFVLYPAFLLSVLR